MSNNHLLLSLGGRCEVAWQIENLFGHQLSGPFDWLVTPLQSIPKLIQERFENIAQPDDLQISHYFHPVTGARLETVLNRRYNVFLHHEFSRDKSGSISATWKDECPTVSDKWKFVAERWFDTLSRAPEATFIRRRGNFSMPDEKDVETRPSDYVEALRELQQICPTARLAVADPGCDLDHPGILTASIGPATPEDWAETGDYWKGATTKWQPFLRGLVG